VKAYSDTAISAETRQALFMRNYQRLEGVIAANHDGAQARDPDATANYLRAIAEQNKMIGVLGGGAVTNINLGGNDAGTSYGVDVRMVYPVEFVRPKDQDEPGERYSANNVQYPKLVETTANEPHSRGSKARRRRATVGRSTRLRKLVSGTAVRSDAAAAGRRARGC
jgi:ABC-type Fe3+ transport system substrate-binding protein